MKITAGSARGPARPLPQPQLDELPARAAAEHLASISGARKRLYFQRQRLLELGVHVVHFLTEIVHRRPRTWKGDVEALYHLLERCGEERLVQAVCSSRSPRAGITFVARLGRSSLKVQLGGPHATSSATKLFTVISPDRTPSRRISGPDSVQYTAPVFPFVIFGTSERSAGVRDVA